MKTVNKFSIVVVGEGSIARIVLEDARRLLYVYRSPSFLWWNLGGGVSKSVAGVFFSSPPKIELLDRVGFHLTGKRLVTLYIVYPTVDDDKKEIITRVSCYARGMLLDDVEIELDDDVWNNILKLPQMIKNGNGNGNNDLKLSKLADEIVDKFQKKINEVYKSPIKRVEPATSMYM